MLNKQQAALLALTRMGSYQAPLALYALVSPYDDYEEFCKDTGYTADTESDLGQFIDEQIRMSVQEKIQDNEDNDIIIDYNEKAYNADIDKHLEIIQHHLRHFVTAPGFIRAIQTKPIFSNILNAMYLVNYELYVLEDPAFNSTPLEANDGHEVMMSFGLLGFDFLRNVFESRGLETEIFDLYDLKEEDGSIEIGITDDDEKLQAYIEKHNLGTPQVEQDDSPVQIQE